MKKEEKKTEKTSKLCQCTSCVIAADLDFMALWERLLITTFPPSTLGEQ